MSRVIAIINEKGGVGKTTTATNMAYLLGKQNKKVLLLDFDGQANSTMIMGDKNSNEIEITISTLINKIITKEDLPPKEDYIIKNKGIDLIPSNSNLFTLERNLCNINCREYILQSFIDEIKKDYDYIIIDCMPQIGTPMINVMISSDSIIIPTQSEILSAKGLAELIKHYLTIKDINKNLKIDGILITMDSKKTIASKEVKKVLEESFGEHINIFQNVIPRSTKVAEANIYKQIICEYLPTNIVSKAYEDFLQEVLKNE